MMKQEIFDKIVLEAGTTGEHQVWFTRPEVKAAVGLTAKFIIEMIKKEAEDAFRANTYMGDDVPSVVHIGNIRRLFGDENGKF